jgi:hypothetical protein
MSKKIDVLSKCKKNERRYILMPADDLKALFFFMSSSLTDFSFSLHVKEKRRMHCNFLRLHLSSIMNNINRNAQRTEIEDDSCFIFVDSAV